MLTIHEKIDKMDRNILQKLLKKTQNGKICICKNCVDKRSCRHWLSKSKNHYHNHQTKLERKQLIYDEYREKQLKVPNSLMMDVIFDKSYPSHPSKLKDICILFNEYYADVNYCQNNQISKTPLIKTMINECPFIFIFLIQRGADIKLITKYFQENDTLYIPSSPASYCIFALLVMHKIQFNFISKNIH
ncbi:unnamed protein product, partial [marine sediment metagenome]